MRTVRVPSPDIEIPEGEEFSDLHIGLKGCYGFVSDVTEQDGDTGLLIFVPSYTLADFEEALAEPDEEDAA